ncbi:hypothetical protein ACE6H2_006704 [Prunus campanulata]
MPLLLRQAYYATCPHPANHHRRPATCRRPPPTSSGHLSPSATYHRWTPAQPANNHPSPACHRLHGTNSVAPYSL